MKYEKSYIQKICLMIGVGFILMILIIYTYYNYSIYNVSSVEKSVKKIIFKSNESDITSHASSTGTQVTKKTTQSTEYFLFFAEFKLPDTLSEFLFNFPWEKFEESMKTKSELLYRQKLVDGIQKFACQEPKVEVNYTCRAPPVLDPSNIQCSNYPDAFLPNKYNTPVKIGHAIQLGFDADSLEIHLNEIYDVIDYFFILEATRLHCKMLRKQLMWSELSVQPRFAKFRDKVIHLVLDDSDIAQIEFAEEHPAWALEILQERLRWAKIKQWNDVSNIFQDNDLIGFGDADEITPRNSIQLLKYCPLKSKSLDIGIWFPFGRMDQAFITDFPVSKKLKYTLGDPTFHRWKDAISFPNDRFPTRNRGKSDSFLLGGIHLTYYTYTPYFILRMLSATECGKWTSKSIQEFFSSHIHPFRKTNSLENMETYFHRRSKNKHLKLLSDIKEDLSTIIYYPWFYSCNKNRYPAWEGKHDSRVV